MRQVWKRSGASVLGRERMMLRRDSELYQRLRQARSSALRAARRSWQVHPTAYIHRTAQVTRDLQAAEYVFVGPSCDVATGVSIGRYTMLAAEVAIVGDDHRIDVAGTPLQFTERPAAQPTEIGRDAWLGRRVILRRGVTIGDGAVVGAAAVVLQDVPPYEVWAGVPARRIRNRFETEAEVLAHRQMLDGPVVVPTFVGPQPGIDQPASSLVSRTAQPAEST